VGDLIGILTRAGVRRLADIRAYPYSARHPWFNKEKLQSELERGNIEYRWLGQELGGRREQRPDSRHTALRPGLRSFADYMETREFDDSVNVLQGMALHTPTAMMCAETNPAECHRSIIADYLTARGARVLHLIDEGPTQAHSMHRAARHESGRLIYDRRTQRDLEFE
jgi:uncharacterized protein (DUF488 family)